MTYDEIKNLKIGDVIGQVVRYENPITGAISAGEITSVHTRFLKTKIESGVGFVAKLIMYDEIVSIGEI